MKVLLVFGTRPEAVKMAPVVAEFKRNPRFECVVCVTAQHRGLLDQVLQFFGIEPDFDLNVMKDKQSLEAITAEILTKVTGVISTVKPDFVFVHGDTTTAFATAIASFYSKIPCVHVEAGLRTGNMHSPWPEEMNRKVLGSLASVHFAPTISAFRNLVSENVPKSQICITGNTGVDALFEAMAIIGRDSAMRQKIKEKLKIDASRKLILVTSHRRESFDSGLSDICRALREIAERDDVQLIYPVHPNPQVRTIVENNLRSNPRISLVEPLTYPEFVLAMKSSYLILTDSGGVQEEAPSLGKPVLVMREATERPEAVEAGAARVVGTAAKGIIDQTNALLNDNNLYRSMIAKSNPFGDGTAARKISEHMKGLEKGK